MRGQSGFTLAELMAVVAITLVACGLAAPGMASMLHRLELRAAASDLFGAIHYTRTQAIERNARVLLAPRRDGQDWTGGWVVFIDADGDRRPGAGDEVLMSHGPMANGFAASYRFSSQAGPSYIAYNGAGRACSASSSSAARWGSITLERGGHARRITINMLGRVRMCEPGRDSACPD